MNARSVEALLVGAYAVAFHAKPRFTKDIDLLVEPNPDNAQLTPGQGVQQRQDFMQLMS